MAEPPTEITRPGRRTTQVDLTQEVQAMRLQGANLGSSKEKQDITIIEAGGTTYECSGRTGKGSFGIVYKATETDKNRVVAIKRVLQDPRYKNRELQIMKMIKHTNCVELLNSFYERSNGEVFLNLVLAYVPKNLYEVCNAFSKLKQRMPILDVKLYVYQLCRSLAYVHSLGICHRDIKPQNLLIDPSTYELKLCDFGSAKILVPSEPNVSYICSRYYRAPELIFGASDYTNAIDVWSSGCVMAELILSQPIFAGESGLDQLVEIIKVLGTPSRTQIKAMNPEYKDYKQFPSIKSQPWTRVFSDDTPALAIDLVSKMLVYPPLDRILPLEVCAHPFFDELRTFNEKSEHQKLPPLFDFTSEEIGYATKNGLFEKLQPSNQTDSGP